MGFVGGGGNIAIETDLPPSSFVYRIVNIKSFMEFLYLIFYACLRLRFLDIETNPSPRRPVPSACRIQCSNVCFLGDAFGFSHAPEWPHGQGGCLACWRLQGCEIESRLWLSCNYLYYSRSALSGGTAHEGGGATSQLLWPCYIGSDTWFQTDLCEASSLVSRAASQ